MKKLPSKLRILKFKKKLRIRDIALATGASLSSASNWTSEKYCPRKIEWKHAIALQELSEGYITIQDCGYKYD